MLQTFLGFDFSTRVYPSCMPINEKCILATPTVNLGDFTVRRRYSFTDKLQFPYVVFEERGLTSFLKNKIRKFVLPKPEFP